MVAAMMNKPAAWRRGQMAGRDARHGAAGALVLLAGLALASSLAAAQPAPPAAPSVSAPAAAVDRDDSPAVAAPEAPAAAEPAPSTYRPGFIDAVSKFVRESVGNFDSGVKDARHTINDLGDKASDAARDAAGTLTQFPNTKVVAGREKCTPAPNGAPDCRKAADTLCRNKGSPKGGKSLEIQSAQKCSAQVWLSGRTPGPGECPLETFVIRAMCN